MLAKLVPATRVVVHTPRVLLEYAYILARVVNNVVHACNSLHSCMHVRLVVKGHEISERGACGSLLRSVGYINRMVILYTI